MNIYLEEGQAPADEMMDKLDVYKRQVRNREFMWF